MSDKTDRKLDENKEGCIKIRKLYKYAKRN